MLYTIAIVLLVLWLLGFFAFHVGSGLIHILLVIAVIMVLINVIQDVEHSEPLVRKKCKSLINLNFRINRLVKLTLHFAKKGYEQMFVVEVHILVLRF